MVCIHAASGVGLVANGNRKARSQSSKCRKHDILNKRILIDSEGSSHCLRQFVIVLGKIELVILVCGRPEPPDSGSHRSELLSSSLKQT